MFSKRKKNEMGETNVKALVHKLAAEWGLSIEYGEEGEGKKQIKVFDGEGHLLSLSVYDRFARFGFNDPMPLGQHARALDGLARLAEHLHYQGDANG